jgi:protein ImuB
MRARRPASPPDPALDPRRPFALILRNNRGAMIHALNPAARAAGLRRGQTQADARAMIPHLICKPADPEADARALRALAVWAERWSPSVSLDPSGEGLEGMFLDVTGATHLFGGETALLAQIRDRLAEAGARARVAMASTPGAAWALARWGEAQGGCIADDETVRGLLASLPVEALRIEDGALTQARRFGLKRIGDLYPMPRAGLARRFRDGDGVGLVQRLDQALGLAGEALTPVWPPPKYRAWQTWMEPVGDIEGVEARLKGLAADLSAPLLRDGQGAKALTLTGFRSDGGTTSLSVRMGRPGRDAGVWLRLFREAGLGQLELGFGLDALMLTADAVEAMTARQGALESEAEAQQAESLVALIDRLTARLGEDRVLVAEPVDSWIPERAERWRPALGRSVSASETNARRPILLLDPPEPVEAIAELPDGAPARFTWRRLSRRVTRADGPERLSPEWWRPRPDDRQARTRDYYRIEDDAGGRYWLFREGLYGREYGGAKEERAPSWWIHGVLP